MSQTEPQSMTASTDFVGDYVKDIRDALSASALAQQHAIIITQPGWGKTRIMAYMAAHIAGEDRFSLIRFNPSSMPAKVEGMPNPAKLLAGEYVMMTQNTPYDPKNRLICLDEMTRASDVVGDMLLDVMDRLDVARPDQAVIWATGNFTVDSARAAALNDRFSLTAHVRPVLSNIGKYLDVRRQTISHKAQTHSPTVPGPIPAWEEVDYVRNLTPGPDAHAVIVGYLDHLQGDAERHFMLNPRRVEQWYDLLFRYSAWITQTDNFSTLPRQATRIMRFAYPTMNWEDFQKWGEVVGVVSDPLASALTEVLSDALDQLRAHHGTARKGSQQQKSTAALAIANIVREGVERLGEIGGNDPRVAEANQTLAKLMNEALTAIQHDRDLAIEGLEL